MLKTVAYPRFFGAKPGTGFDQATPIVAGWVGCLVEEEFGFESAIREGIGASNPEEIRHRIAKRTDYSAQMPSRDYYSV